MKGKHARKAIAALKKRPIRQGNGSAEELKALALSWLERAIHPIICRLDLTVVDGHRRIAGLELLGETEVEVFITEEELDDNQLTQIALTTAIHRADLSGYDLVLAPLLYMVKAGVAEKLEAFVAGGGTFLTTYLSGMVDENDLVFENGYPGPLSDLLGLWVEEIDRLPLTQTNQMVFASPFGESGDCCECGLLYERIHAQSARVLATYGEQFYAGEAAFTVNRFGQGRAYYLATLPETKALASLLRQLCLERDITPPLGGKSMAGVEITARLSPAGETLFYVLNHNDFPTAVSLPNGKFTDLISDTVWSDELTMNAYDVRILQAQGQ